MSPEIITIAILILNIALTELALSADNASVIAIIVKDLNPKDREKARWYGLAGAMLFRFLSIFIVSWLTSFWIFKIVGGLYLLRLGYTGLTPAIDSIEEGGIPIKKTGWLVRTFGSLWATIIILEGTDIVFAVDQMLAVVSMTDVLWIICVGVGIGIVSMRKASVIFSNLIDKYPVVEKVAYWVVIVLGIRITFSGVVQAFKWESVSKVLDSHTTDLVFSALIMGLFFIPVLWQKYFAKKPIKIVSMTVDELKSAYVKAIAEEDYIKAGEIAEELSQKEIES